MDKFFNSVMKKKKTVLVIFAIIIILSAVGFTLVNIESDVIHYLPDSTDTKLGLGQLESAFGIKGDGSLALTNVDKETVYEIIEEISAKKAINKIAWVGSFDPLLVQIEEETNPDLKATLQASYDKVYNKYYKKDTNTYIIGLYFNEKNTSDAVVDCLDSIDLLMAETLDSASNEMYSLGGSATNARALLESSIGEIPKFLLVAVIVIFFILLIMSKSFMEPFIFLATLGISIVINAGTNCILPSVSSITFSSSTILQLALAMDYSIFLMHTYYEERKLTTTSKEALRNAMPKTIKTVGASALTTIGGFVALFAMQFGMGFDLGIVLAKGVFMSLVTVLVLQPILIVISEKLIDKWKHKEIKISFKFADKVNRKVGNVFIAIALIAVIPTFFLQFQAKLNYLTVTEKDTDLSTSEIVLDAEKNQLIVMLPFEKKIDTQNPYYMAHREFIKNTLALDGVKDVFGIFTMIDSNTYVGGVLTDNPSIKILEQSFLSTNFQELYATKGYALYTVTISKDIESQESYTIMNQIKTINQDLFGKEEVFGDAACFYTGLTEGAYDLQKVTPTDFIIVSVLSAVIIFIVLLMTVRSFSLSMMLLLVVELGIWINLTLVTLTGNAINFMSYIIISSIQLGACIDYAILLACKYKEYCKTQNTFDAIKNATIQAGPSIFMSALVLIATAMSVFFVTSNVIVSEITKLISIGAALSVILVVTLLPSILYLAAKIKQKKHGDKAIMPKEPVVEEIEATSSLSDVPPVQY